jgi:hypothetical protein
LISAALACGALSACAGLPFFGKRSTPAAAPLSSNWQATMRRTGCYGRCPSYTVSVTGDGKVSFTGERFVATSGEQAGAALPEALERLQEKIQSPQVAAIGNSYVAGEAACGVWATDFPTITLDFSVDGRERHVRHYLGCEKAPQALRDLETMIDAAADVHRWTQGVSAQ